jgi:MOSC domain-containing protein YiiM
MNTPYVPGSVVSVSLNAEPGLPKQVVDSIRLVEDFGVSGDYHAGRFVRHRCLAEKDPTAPNLRQVLLVDTSIIAELAQKDIQIDPGMLGENILVGGIMVMTLAIGTHIKIGETLLEVTEIRNPCYQLNEMHPHLLKAVVSKVHGQVRRNAGMMARILEGGWVRPGDPVVVCSKHREM